jgi:hypothetical protein
VYVNIYILFIYIHLATSEKIEKKESKKQKEKEQTSVVFFAVFVDSINLTIKKITSACCRLSSFYYYGYR